jgi:hypothetical protein
MTNSIVRIAAWTLLTLGPAVGVGQTFPVQKSGSDARAQDFNRRVLPAAQSLLAGTLGEAVTYAIPLDEKLDASRVYLRYDSKLSVRVYFLNSVTSCDNQLGVYVKQSGAAGAGQSLLLFSQLWSGQLGMPKVLSPGDFVDIGRMPGGAQLDPYLISGCFKPSRIISTDPAKNYDRRPHVACFVMDDRYLIVGFEDGLDFDYQDAVVVCDFGKDNALAFKKPKLPH